jgi:hypothetical protein
MRTVFAGLLALSLVIHAAIGCCWFCAHPDACSSCLQASDVQGPDCCHRHSGAPQRDGTHGPCKSRSGCRGLCIYLPAQKVQVGKLLVLVPIDFAAIGSTSPNSPGNAELSANLARKFVPEPPLRLHLFHRILLI